MGHESPSTGGVGGGDSSTTTTTSTAASSSRRLAQSKRQKALEIEKNLSTLIKSKGPFDPSTQILRNNLRELYESIILEDHEFAESREIEQLLWRLHYIRIEEFRAQIRKSMAAAGSSSSTVNVPVSGGKPNSGRQQVQKVTTVFRSFLSEATGFYHDLILKIRSKHRLSEEDLFESKYDDENDQRVAEIKRCQLSCHRCHIFLGDLARYKEYYSDTDPKKHDWSIAAGFYVKAAALWPSSGNPHNQLAVLATYAGDEMLAVYHYFRSLAAENPFLTAKDNLVLVFEQNRHNYLRLVTSSLKVPEGTANSGLSAGKDDKQVESISDAPNCSDVIKHFQLAFVRLSSILFTTTSLNTFPEVQSCVLSKLEKLLQLEDSDRATFFSHSSLKGNEPNLFIQIVSILIFIVHHVNAGADSHQPTYAGILQRSAMLKHAVTATFQCATYIIQHCVKADDPSSSVLLPSVLILVEWLSCRPEIATGSDMKEEENTARSSFWKNCVDLLNKFLDVSSELKNRLSKNSMVSLMLWEDYELWGFVPLLPMQVRINFTKRSTTGLGSKKEKLARIERLIQAGKVISTQFAGNDRGIYYDEEVDLFFLACDKKANGKKRAITAPRETAEESCVKIVEPVEKHVNLEKPVKSIPSKEEEDEEVIVFKPSVKHDKQTVLDSRNDETYGLSVEGTMSSLLNNNHEAMTAASHNTNSSNCSPETSQPLLPSAMYNVQSVSSHLPSLTTGFQLPATSTVPSFEAYRALQNSPGALDGMLNVPGSGYTTVYNAAHPEWRAGAGFGLTSSQQPWNPITANVNWQPQDVLACRPDIGSANASSGFQTFTHTDTRPTLMTIPSSLTNTVLSTTPLMSEVANRAPCSMADCVIQTKPSLSAADAQINDGSHNILQGQSSMQSLGFVAVDSPSSMPQVSSLSDNEKAHRRGVTVSTGMRPPPGFGPLPSKFPSPLSTSSAVPLLKPGPAAQVANLQVPANIGAQKTPITMGNHVTDYRSLDGHGNHVTDYGLLDGYGRIKREIEQLGNTVQGTNSFGYGRLPGGTYPALEATVSPFPGMKLSDRFMTSTVSSQPQQSAMNQEFLQRQQLVEQHQHLLLQQQQRRQLQQLYAAQLAAHQIQRQHYVQEQQPMTESQQQQQPHPQQGQQHEQSRPQSLWS